MGESGRRKEREGISESNAVRETVKSWKVALESMNRIWKIYQTKGYGKHYMQMMPLHTNIDVF